MTPSERQIVQQMRDAMANICELQGECRLDHHGLCQEHSLQEADECEIYIAKSAIDAADKLLNTPTPAPSPADEPVTLQKSYQLPGDINAPSPADPCREALVQCVEAMLPFANYACDLEQSKTCNCHNCNIRRVRNEAFTALAITGPNTPDPLPDCTMVKIGENLYPTREFQVTKENGVVITLDEPETNAERLRLLADAMEVCGNVFFKNNENRVSMINDMDEIAYGYSITPSDLRRAAEKNQ